MANTKGSSVISNPKGGGAQSGLGEKFSPDLFTGTGNFSVPIAVPPGRNGFQPELTLGYSSGNGNSIFGMGWALGVPGVTRKTAKGIPVYDDRSDIFILSGAEDLVPVEVEEEILSGNIGWQRTYYRPRTEGLFARIIRHKKTNGEHYWEVRSKGGLVSWYGTQEFVPYVDASGNNIADPAVIANPEIRESIFAWHLTKTEDPFGNVIQYEYTRDLVVIPEGRKYDQIYLSKIKYCQYPDSGETKFLCEVWFNYEDRPDPFSSYKQGFEVRTVRRCTSIETYSNAVSLIKVKTYHFTYPAIQPLNGATQLESVSVEGHNGAESEWMPPLEFSYSAFDPTKRDLKDIKGPFPVMSVGEPGFELVDLDGNGLPDLLQLNGTARYWTNKGNGEFSQPRNLDISPSVRLGTPGVQFFDANGDGRNDLLVCNGLVAGYFPGAFHKVWDSKSFVPFTKVPSFTLADREVQLMDLDGDGITDVLRNGKRFECFYNDPEKGFTKSQTVTKTFADFSFSNPNIRFADMTGDGLQDIVLISSGRVQYWPNMGYGRFGAKVNMTNAPRFPESYNPSQVLLGDLDGDGQADIAYVDNRGVTLFVNQAGNSFSDGVLISNTPPVTNPQGLRIIDIMGQGQAGILWSYAITAGTPGKMYFLDFTSGNKPYVLEQMDNNMGSITSVKYGSSVYHYLRDQKRPETRWKTDLPFPVQVVNRVEVLDLLSGGKLVTEYSYHNGYWDGMEREFRGFAHVDTLDTETFDKLNTQDLFTSESVNTVSSGHYSPPTLSKNWFYVGPVGDGYSRWHEPDFSDEFWSGDEQILERPQNMVALLASLPRRARRDALRTLKGSQIRTELYALDGSSLQEKPYTVTESLMSLRKEFDPSQQPVPLWNDKNAYWSGGGYVFFSFNIAQRTTQYERGNDPMHNFSFTQDYDVYGQPLGQLSAGLPRGADLLGGGNGDYLGTYSLNEYIYADSRTSPAQYMVTRVKRSRSWDATKNAINTGIFNYRDGIFSGFSSLPLLGCTLNYYDGAAFVGEDYGVIGAYGAQVRSETLIITDDIITAAYSTTPQCFKTVPDWSSGYPSTFAAQLQNADDRLGYKDRRAGYPDHEPGWYSESARLKYDFQDSIPTDQMVGRVFESKDVFDALSTIAYDSYLNMPVISRQYLDLSYSTYLETSADYDYRVMQPYQVKDINENYSEFDFSPLGLLRATALIGKGTEGDYKSGSGGFYDRYAPSVQMEYDFFAFVTSGDPVWVKTVSREKHYQQLANSPTIQKVEYSDGFGRLLQTRVQAEDLVFGPSPGGTLPNMFGASGLPADQSLPNADCVGTKRGGSDALNVVVSGWKIYNNKGKVVEQYEPFFDRGFDFVLPDTLGVKIKMFYDALGRVVKTKNPDNSEQWVLYGVPVTLNVPSDPVNANWTGTRTPWMSFTYDANDLASITIPSGSNVPSSHYFTPKSSEVDALGRTIKTDEYFDNTNYSDTIRMQYRYDIRGNLLLVYDPYMRAVFTHIYDLRTPQKGEDGKQQPLPPLQTVHIDKGLSTVVFDVLGKPMETNDAKGARALSGYDVISRPGFNWAQNDSGSAPGTLRQFTVYGDTGGTGASDNMNGKPYEAYDEAGKQTLSSYDFKGNVLSKKREIVDDSVLQSALLSYTSFIMDWDSPPTLSGIIFQTDIRYDALNRVTSITLPQDVSSDRKDIIPTYNNAGALQSVAVKGNTGFDTYVEHIAYNAKGQRLIIAFGNGIMTRYAYNSSTFRLQRQRSESYTKSSSGSTITYTYNSGTNVQDDGFNFDLVGNIVKILGRVTDCGIQGTTLGPDALDREFEYDPLYRLTYGNGREANTQSGNSYLYDDAPDPGSPNANNVRAYDRTYTYDKLGNILTVVQGGTDGFTRDYTYNSGSNTLQKIEDATPSLIEDYTYDSCGNTITAGSTRYYVWNHADQLLCYYNQAGGGPPTIFTQYDYDSSGQRVSKLVMTAGFPAFERTINIDGIFEYVRLDDAGGPYEKNYINVMDDKSRVAEIRVNAGPAFPSDISDNITYLLEDQIGSSILRTDTAGNVIDKEEYYPFGDSSLRTFLYKRYRYVGKQKDGESGLYYYGARYYVAWIGRFLNVDPCSSLMRSYSPYSYAADNPISFKDDTGMVITPADADSKVAFNKAVGEVFKNNNLVKDMLTIGDSGKLGTISQENYQKAMQSLKDPDQRALFNGLANAAGSEKEYNFQVINVGGEIKRGEKSITSAELASQNEVKYENNEKQTNLYITTEGSNSGSKSGGAKRTDQGKILGSILTAYVKFDPSTGPGTSDESKDDIGLVQLQMENLVTRSDESIGLEKWDHFSGRIDFHNSQGEVFSEDELDRVEQIPDQIRYHTETSTKGTKKIDVTGEKKER